MPLERLRAGLQCAGERVSFGSFQRGIHRARIQHGPAALTLRDLRAPRADARPGGADRPRRRAGGIAPSVKVGPRGHRRTAAGATLPTMAARRFRPAARVALFLAAQGRCAACGEPLRPGWHADHVEPVSAGGRDGAGERAGAVPALQPGQGRAAGVIAPRPGRRTSSRATPRTSGRTSCWSRRPGAGKTLAACQAIRAAGAEQIVVVCPTTALRAQWADAADRVGLHLDPRWRNADGAWRADIDGVVVTYQQVASAPDLFAHHLARPTFVVLDEIHHAGESASWGTALRAAFDGAPHRLALSGTPFRSDARAIPFVRYDEERRCAPDFVYGYGEAVARRASAGRSRSGCWTRRCAGAWTRRRRSRRSPTSSTRPTTRAGCGPRSTRPRRCCRRCCATPTRCWSRRAR